jgi:DNA modification methylase
MDNNILCGDAPEVLKTLAAESVHCCITSPPYYGLRDYGVGGQIGLEATPAEYVSRLVDVFRQVRRVLRQDGTLWIVIADSYAGSAKGALPEKRLQESKSKQRYRYSTGNPAANIPKTWPNIKPKDMIGVPWLLAFALRDDGWYLRSEIIWHKPNALPESCRDRPTRSCEHIFLLAKSSRYYYDQAAVAEPIAEGTRARMRRAVSANHKYANAAPGQSLQTFNQPRPNRSGAEVTLVDTRNLRNMWSVSAKSYHGAHFATYPAELITPCVLAGCTPGGVVLDPFFGSGSTGEAALKLGRRYLGVDLNPAYCRLAEERLKGVSADVKA